jgi:uncharacterized coiled-coil protein SlyX
MLKLKIQMLEADIKEQEDVIEYAKGIIREKKYDLRKAKELLAKVEALCAIPEVEKEMVEKVYGLEGGNENA